MEKTTDMPRTNAPPVIGDCLRQSSPWTWNFTTAPHSAELQTAAAAAAAMAEGLESNGPVTTTTTSNASHTFTPIQPDLALSLWNHTTTTITTTLQQYNNNNTIPTSVLPQPPQPQSSLQPTRSPFLRLPLEIRDQIYAFVLGRWRGSIIACSSQGDTSIRLRACAVDCPPGQAPDWNIDADPLLSVSRQVRTEALCFLCNRSRIYVRSLESLPLLWDFLGPQPRRYIRMLRLRCQLGPINGLAERLKSVALLAECERMKLLTLRVPSGIQAIRDDIDIDDDDGDDNDDNDYYDESNNESRHASLASSGKQQQQQQQEQQNQQQKEVDWQQLVRRNPLLRALGKVRGMKEVEVVWEPVVIAQVAQGARRRRDWSHAEKGEEYKGRISSWLIQQMTMAYDT